MVWEVLTDEHGHLTAHDILERAHRHDPSMNLSSVYRTLGLFTELGLVRESNLGTDGSTRWEPAHDNDKVHLVCVGCGAVEHHEAEPAAALLHHLEATHGFVASDVEVQVRGRCRPCSETAGPLREASSAPGAASARPPHHH